MTTSEKELLLRLEASRDTHAVRPCSYSLPCLPSCGMPAHVHAVSSTRAAHAGLVHAVAGAPGTRRKRRATHRVV
jgi:hypothetical protein